MCIHEQPALLLHVYVNLRENESPILSSQFYSVVHNTYIAKLCSNNKESHA